MTGKLKAESEIQHAHDLLMGIVIDEVDMGLDADTKRALHASLDVLCWVLNHTHNTTFEENLKKLLAECKKRGREVIPVFHVNLSIGESSGPSEATALSETEDIEIVFGPVYRRLTAEEEAADDLRDPPHPTGYECACGNSISYEESEGGQARICNRCNRGGLMEPVYD